MKHSRFQRLYREQSNEVKKVYDAMPKSEGWTAHQLLNELVRTQRPMRLEVIAGCLGHLAHVGLAKQSGNRYQLVSVDAPVEDKSTIVMPNDYAVKLEYSTGVDLDTPPVMQIVADSKPTRTVIMTTKPDSILDIFTLLAQRTEVLANKAHTLNAELIKLRTDIESAGLQVAEITDKDAADLDKLRQLRLMIKEL